MSTEDITALKQALVKALEEKDKALISSIRGKLASLSEAVDTVIRDHQREIKFETKEYIVEVLVKKYSEGLETDTNELFIPEYQREFKWKQDRQSKLIESLLIGLPIPYVFTADINNEDPELDGRVEIVDGVQRISTIYAFVTNQLQLTDLKLLKELNGFKFEDLALSRQRRFNRIPIRVIELGENCDEKTRRDLFERINSGSLELEAQEKRHGSTLADSTFYKAVLMECAKDPQLHVLAPVSKAKKLDGEYIELVLRFFAYTDKYEDYTGEVANFLNDYLGEFVEKDKRKEPVDVQLYISTFKAMLNFVQDNFEFGFRKTAGSNSTPRARFEAISVGAALALKEDNSIATDKGEVSSWLFSEDFKEATTSDGANNVGNFFKRIGFVRDKLLGK